MAGFFRKLGREKLYKQWVDKEGLSPDDLPPDLKKDTKDSVEVDSVDEVIPRREFRSRTGQQGDNITTSISIRFIFIMALIIVVLLVIVSVLATVLIMR